MFLVDPSSEHAMLCVWVSWIVLRSWLRHDEHESVTACVLDSVVLAGRLAGARVVL